MFPHSHSNSHSDGEGQRPPTPSGAVGGGSRVCQGHTDGTWAIMLLSCLLLTIHMSPSVFHRYWRCVDVFDVLFSPFSHPFLFIGPALKSSVHIILCKLNFIPHTSHADRWLLCSAHSFSRLEFLVPVRVEMCHQTGQQITHCESMKDNKNKPMSDINSITEQSEAGFASMILTNRKEDEHNDKHPKASFAPIKVIKFSGISAAMQHFCFQLRGLRTGVTYEQHTPSSFVHLCSENQHTRFSFYAQKAVVGFYRCSRRRHDVVCQRPLHSSLQQGRRERSRCGSFRSRRLWTNWATATRGNTDSDKITLGQMET